MLVDSLAALRPQRLGIKEPDYAVRIAHRRHFRVCYNDRDLRKAHCERCTALDPGGAVAYHPIEHLPKLADDAPNALFSQGVFVAGLRGRKQCERVDAFVANKGLLKFGDALD